jgi:hypothetical protein
MLMVQPEERVKAAILHGPAVARSEAEPDLQTIQRSKLLTMCCSDGAACKGGSKPPYFMVLQLHEVKHNLASRQWVCGAVMMHPEEGVKAAILHGPAIA